MGKTYRFLSAPIDSQVVCGWFRDLDPCPVEQATEKGTIYYFKHLGALHGEASRSPIVNVIFPRIRRGVLTTAGEIHFLATPLKQFPDLDRINRAFRKWISGYPVVHSAKNSSEGAYDYFLEGSLRNMDSDIFAFPSGLQALDFGRYFVADDDSDARLDDLCRQLRLRGVEEITKAEHAAPP